MDFATRQLLWTIIAPLLVGALATLPALALSAKSSPRRDRAKRFILVLGVGLGYLVAHIVIWGWPGWPVTSTGEKTFLVAVVAILIGFFEAADIANTLVRTLLRLAMAVAIAWYFMSVGFRDRAGWLEELVWIVGPALVTTLAWTSTDMLANRGPRGSLPVSLGILCGITAIVVFKSGTASQAQQIAALGLAIGGMGLMAFFIPGISVARGAVAVFIPLYYSFLLISRSPEMPTAVPIILGVAPLFLWIANLRPVLVANSARILIVTTLALLALVILLWLELDAAAPESLY